MCCIYVHSMTPITVLADLRPMHILLFKNFAPIQVYIPLSLIYGWKHGIKGGVGGGGQIVFQGK